MPSAFTVRTFVHDQAITRMVLPGGQVFQSMYRIGQQMESVAQVEAPKRTHRMANTLRVSTTPVGTRGLQTNLRATVHYAKYVVKGTTGPIRSTSGKMLRFVSTQGYGSSYGVVLYRRQVRGQRANDFLTRAMVFVLRANRLA